jgi:hypothetical protein
VDCSLLCHGNFFNLFYLLVIILGVVLMSNCLSDKKKYNCVILQFINSHLTHFSFRYLTWFGHSLNQYRSVVRLYDYFLASEPLMPLYLTAAIVLYREEDIFREDCDRATLHCLLSQLPDELPFEYLLVQSEKLYEKYPPHNLHRDIEKIIERE